uniref:mucin-1 isoform X3 n=1 Tax=Podarcis muralis TaxID=64176 RepID=UPI00109F8BA8|nr:mucin-1 isoform X3 [Podarcis muralis]
MERNILEMITLALMLVALCPEILVCSSYAEPEGVNQEDAISASTETTVSESLPTPSLLPTMSDTSSTKDSSTGPTPVEGTTNSQGTNPTTEGSTETSTSSVEPQGSTATSTTGTPLITSPTESSATATTFEGTTKSHVTEIFSASTEGSTENSTSSGEPQSSTATSTTGTPPITSPTESSATATTFEGTTKSHVTEIFSASTEGSTENSTSSGEPQSSTATSKTGTPPITSPTESSATATTFEGTTKSHVTEIFSASTEGSTETSTSSGEPQSSTATSPPGTTPTAAPTEPPLTNFNITFHIAMDFTDDLKNSTSEAYRNLTGKIGKMYDDIYNCSTCHAKYGTYLGFTVNKFSSGSVLADTTVHFEKSADVSAGVIRTALSNATEDQWQGLNLTQIEVTKQETTTTPSPTTTSTSSKTTTPKPPIEQTFTITYHITMNFTEDLLDSSSEAYRSLNETIGKMYEEVFNCTGCLAEGKYMGYKVNSFSSGSVLADTTVRFQESAGVSADTLRTALSDAPEDKRQGLNLTQIEVTKQEMTTTPSPTTTSTSSKTTTPKPPIEQTFTITYHITMNFTEDLLDSSSEAYRSLNETIGKMYEEVFNCTGCLAEGKYMGYKVNSFRSGSVLADTTVHFEKSTDISAGVIRTALSNATEDQRQGLNLTQIEVTKQETTTTPSPTTTSTSSKTPAPKPPKEKTFTITYHITMNYTKDLLDSSSQAYQNLTGNIKKMYVDVFNCTGCPAEGKYIGYKVNSFRNGSVLADTTVRFQESADVSADKLRTALSDAPENKRHGLTLTQIEVTSDATEPPNPPPSTATPPPATTSTTTSTTTTPNHTETVPGWGIALLVLVCILLLLALIAFLILIIYWCRRNHRGKLDLLSNQDSYHVMKSTQEW